MGGSGGTAAKQLYELYIVLEWYFQLFNTGTTVLSGNCLLSVYRLSIVLLYRYRGIFGNYTVATIGRHIINIIDGSKKKN